MFIVFEGIDGSGKSTQIELLNEKLTQSGLEVHTTAEPTNSVFGLLLKKAMKGTAKTNQQSIAAMFLADRLDHIQKSDTGILARIAKGQVVIGSRYYFSSIAFQSEYVSKDWIKESVRHCSKLLKADITIYLNISPETSLDRIKKRNKEIEIYENLSKLKKTHKAYLEAFEEYKDEENIFIVDAGKSVNAIHSEIIDIIKTSSTKMLLYS